MTSDDPEAQSLSGHLRTLGGCWIVYGAICLVLATLLVFYSGTATVMFGALLSRVPDPFTLMGVFHFMYIVMIVVSIVCGILGLMAGLALTFIFVTPRDAEAILPRTITFITLPSGFKIPSDDTDEVAVFPTGKRDDAVDDTAQALNCLRQGSIVPPTPFLMPGDLHSTELDQEELWEKAMQGVPMTSKEIDRM